MFAQHRLATNNSFIFSLQRARAQGSFKNLPGTGRPLSNDPLQANPYISRSEFFMNRIGSSYSFILFIAGVSDSLLVSFCPSSSVKNNEALPAWIQYQKEHTNGLDHLRLKLSEAVERRLRLLPGGGVIEGIDESEGARLRGLGLSREFEVGGKDRSFWEGMVEEVNKLQRRGDGIAPASARRGCVSCTLSIFLWLITVLMTDSVHSLSPSGRRPSIPSLQSPSGPPTVAFSRHL